MTLAAIKFGSDGPLVTAWQHFLIGRGLLRGLADGKFGPKTQLATRRFQREQKLQVDGVVGNRTFAQAMTHGFTLVEDPENADRRGPNWPAPPTFKYLGLSQRQKLFGPLNFEVVDPRRGKVRILDNWARANIVRVEVPQLKAITRYFRVQLHRKIAPQFLALWSAWEAEGLLDRVVSWQGSFVPRLIRGSDKTLSNHAFGTAFDINAAYNRLGHEPARVGATGCVRELVPLAHKFGFFWGGHYRRRADGMHFEAVRIVDVGETV